MQITKVSSESIIANSFMLKPNFHLNFGKRRIERAKKQGLEFQSLGNVTDEVFTGGIFKRIFVDKAEYGLPYISAQHMMNSNPLDVAKIISRKFTPRQDDMSLKENQILVSCAGTVGNVKLITRDLQGVIGSQDIIRVNTDNNKLPYGYLYAFLASQTAYTYIQSFIYGSVVPRIDPNTLKKLPVPILPEATQQKIHNLIVDAAALRVEANKLLREANIKILKYCKLSSLKNEDYEYFGNYTYGRSISTFKINIKEISAISINAFNYSKRISNLKDRIKTNSYLNLSDCLIDNNFFSTGSFKRLEVTSDKHIKLLNQSDIFNSRKIGKNISRAFVGNVRLVEYGEVLIAGVGTLGESETFCRVIFGNEEIEDQLISGEFIRMKVNEKIIPSGYLFAWLNSDYGFRLIRATHSGTKLCRPIPELLKQIPIPILENNRMHEIDFDVKSAHTKLFAALNKENQAIELIEKEIDQWQQ
ncbi:TPA: restriction endonuclease subunit S [Elizabethkingia anophelis]|nr:restriction endonuclease subunit S [Chryseobacterium gambrini]HAY3534790.1 restriction endonuclease subunit S [Elizabethkingia anophelis]HAY3546906.1 restriction endonuclease subunit S [Elizabethkingia anophelis]